jgi:large subunit ribosomal protein L22
MSPVKEFMARHRFAHITARKARYVADLIRGRGVNEALELLQFTPNRGATFYGKVLRSAIANASQDEDVNINRLFVSQCTADDGPLLQGRMRFRPGPQGRAMPFSKRLSHLTVKVAEAEDAGAEKRGSLADESASAEAPAEAGKKGRGAKKGSKSKAKAPAAKSKAAAGKKPKTAKKSAKSTGKGSEEKKA